MPTSTQEKQEQKKNTGRLPATFRAAGVVILMALVGWVLSQLGQLDAVLQVQEHVGPAGNKLLIIEETVQGKPVKRQRVVLSRVPVEVDRRRSVLMFEVDGTRRVLPPGAPTVLVHADRRIEPLPHPLPALVFLQLKNRPPRNERLPEWFRQPMIRAAMAGSDARLRDFWDRP